MIVYKVARSLNSPMSDPRLYQSAIIRGPFCQAYALGETTYPPEEFPDAWLFAFKTFVQAVEWRKYHYQITYPTPIVLEAEVLETRELLEMSGSLGTGSLTSFWSQEEKKKMLRTQAGNVGFKLHKCSPPDGTILCSELKILREIPEEEISTWMKMLEKSKKFLQ